LEADYVVLGGGNARLLKKLPPGSKPETTTMHFAAGFGFGKNPVMTLLKNEFICTPRCLWRPRH
jgi:hypothetical protein